MLTDELYLDYAARQLAELRVPDFTEESEDLVLRVMDRVFREPVLTLWIYILTRKVKEFSHGQTTLEKADPLELNVQAAQGSRYFVLRYGSLLAVVSFQPTMPFFKEEAYNNKTVLGG